MARDYRIEVDKVITAKPGDMVVIRPPDGMDTYDIWEAMKSLRAQLAEGVMIVALPQGMDLEHLSAEEMARFGWVRAH